MTTLSFQGEIYNQDIEEKLMGNEEINDQWANAVKKALGKKGYVDWYSN